MVGSGNDLIRAKIPVFCDIVTCSVYKCTHLSCHTHNWHCFGHVNLIQILTYFMFQYWIRYSMFIVHIQNMRVAKFNIKKVHLIWNIRYESIYILYTYVVLKVSLTGRCWRILYIFRSGHPLPGTFLNCYIILLVKKCFLTSTCVAFVK